MNDFIKFAQAIELGSGDYTGALGSGVNKALADTSEKVFEVKQSVAQLRKLAARVESTTEASFEIEKFSNITTLNGGDLEDGTDMGTNWTPIDNQSLITFNNSTDISVGFKITPRLLRQARQDMEAFLDRYRRKVAFDLARREDTYIVKQIGSNSSISNFYGSDEEAVGSITAGDVMTIELFESMLDQIKENEYEPTDFIAPAKVAGQLRRDARLANANDYSVAIREDGSAVTQVGDVIVHEIKGTTIIPQDALGSESALVTYGYMMDRSSAFGIVDFLKRPGATPVQMSVGQPDPTLAGANYWRILGQQEIEAKVLDPNAVAKVTVSVE